MKQSLIRIASMTALSFGLTTTAFADNSGENSKNFEDRIVSYQKFCSDGCKNPFSETAAFEFAEADQSQLDPATRTQLQEIAVDQAQIWGDTILEGDYVAAGKTQLYQVFAIYENRKFLGYKITYSEEAWYTGDCNFDYDDRSTLKECTPGRIRESSFVSPDFTTYFRDESNYAEFKSSKD